MIKNDIFYMNQALKLAKKAASQGEVPVGALIVKGDEVIATGFNNRESKQSPLSHAEIEAIDQASKHLKSWRLEDCKLYCTLEPCLMCIGTILQARIPHLIYACKDPKSGFDSFHHLTESKTWNNNLKIENGILEKECSQILKDFFQSLR